jgi:hypothetical protein
VVDAETNSLCIHVHYLAEKYFRCGWLLYSTKQINCTSLQQAFGETIPGQTQKSAARYQTNFPFHDFDEAVFRRISKFDDTFGMAVAPINMI